MAVKISARALERWSMQDVSIARRPNGSLACRFRYEGSTCRDGGRTFPSVVVATLDPAGEKHWRIADVRVEIDTAHPGWRVSCLNESAPGFDPDRLTADSPARGMLLDDFLAADWPVDPAGCYCSSVQVSHKVILALSAIRHRLRKDGLAG